MWLEYGKTFLGRKTIELKPVTNAPPVSIGSGKNQDVVLEDPQCTEAHASIRYWDDCFVLMNKDAKNGTTVDGNRVEVCRIQPGDIIKIGETKLQLLADEKHYRDDVTIRR